MSNGVNKLKMGQNLTFKLNLTLEIVIYWDALSDDISNNESTLVSSAIYWWATIL